MKNALVFFALTAWLGHFGLFAQSKKELKTQVQNLQQQYDSLLSVVSTVDSIQTDSGMVTIDMATENARLSADLDTSRMMMVGIIAMIMDSVDSDMDLPATKVLYDSLLAHPDRYSLQGLKEKVKVVRDSVVMLSRERDSLARDNKTMKELFQFLVGGNQHPYDAKDLIGKWEFALNEVNLLGDSTGASGLVTQPSARFPDDMKSKVLKALNLVDKELAELEFMDGSKMRCFYKIHDFSKEKPYYIDLRNMDDINIRLFVNHNYNGVQVSYRLKSGEYLFGYMRK